MRITMEGLNQLFEASKMDWVDEEIDEETQEYIREWLEQQDKIDARERQALEDEHQRLMAECE